MDVNIHASKMFSTDNSNMVRKLKKSCESKSVLTSLLLFLIIFERFQYVYNQKLLSFVMI